MQPSPARVVELVSADEDDIGIHTSNHLRLNDAVSVHLNSLPEIQRELLFPRTLAEKEFIDGTQIQIFDDVSNYKFTVVIRHW